MKKINYLNKVNIPLSPNLARFIKIFEPESKDFIINSRTYRVRDPISTETLSFSFVRGSHFSYDKPTFIKDSALPSIREYQTRLSDKQRSSVLQQLNQALDKGVDEFVDVVCSSQIQKEALEKKKVQIKSHKFLKIFTNFFALNKQNFKNGSKNCVDEFNFYSVNKLKLF